MGEWGCDSASRGASRARDRKFRRLCPRWVRATMGSHAVRGGCGQRSRAGRNESAGERVRKETLGARGRNRNRSESEYGKETLGARGEIGIGRRASTEKRRWAREKSESVGERVRKETPRAAERIVGRSQRARISRGCRRERGLCLLLALLVGSGMFAMLLEKRKELDVN